jgi:hypothetical protein
MSGDRETKLRSDDKTVSGTRRCMRSCRHEAGLTTSQFLPSTPLGRIDSYASSVAVSV